ncbi:MAG: virulence RhuM family protein [Thermodesulfobacteriota bacterium]|nr:virulence RhuM family protein [Thermodesulfobacteriota bacterium]
MAKNIKIPDNQITVYQTSDGKINIEVLYANENIWLPQKRIAELFDVDRSVVTKHLKNIFSNIELEEDSVCAKFAHTAEDGKEYQTKFYSLEAIIAVGYRVNSERGTQFRQWAISILQKYIHKGFAIDSDRFKYGSRFSARYFDDLLEEIRDIRASERMVYQKITDIYATSIDYSVKAEDTKKFFATVQNKLHFAITGQTAAEIIAKRADNAKPNMGLTSWRKGPIGKIMPSDVSIAKNYLKKQELDHLNRIVTMYLDFAELQAVRNIPMYMKDWIEKLNAFLKFSEYEILTNAGSVRHEVALALAHKEYEIFKKVQDKKYISDFDREVKLLLDKSKHKSI